MKLQGTGGTVQTALVTGASKGIGAGIAAAFGRAGMNVIVNYASSDREANTVVKAIEGQGGHAIALRGSVANEAELASVYDQAAEMFGTVNILVNNAGIMRSGAVEEVTAESFRDQFDTNVLGMLLSTKLFSRQAVEGGSVINISALAVRYTPANQGVYSATKAAVNALTQTHAKELGPRGIRVNAISPGLISTEGTRASGLMDSEMGKMRIAQTPLRRAGAPDDIADVALFLASDAARYVTGQILAVSGGN